MQVLIKYPKTQHILGSKECDVDLCPKKFDFNYPSIDSLKPEGNIVIEEKMDGMGIGIYFENNIAYVQFRNHIFAQDNCPKEFKNIFTWIKSHPNLSLLLKDKIMFGEWMEYKHCVYYDNLPSYFIEYDIFDIKREVFLDTPTRKNLLNTYHFNNEKIISAHVVHQNGIKTTKDLVNLLGIKTAFGKSVHCSQNFLTQYSHLSNPSLYDNYPEGFYIKTECDGVVVGRYKFIRKSFLNKITNNQHWNNNPIKNKLAY